MAGRNGLIDVRGNKYGYLTVIERSKSTYKSPRGRIEGKWILECECGEKIERTRQALRKAKTCGGLTCKRKWVKNLWEVKKGFSLGEKKLSSWHRLQAELKHLRVENAVLKLKINGISYDKRAN